MPLSGSAFWGVILPVGDRTNLIQNPSFERGTANWGTIQAGTIGTTSAFQQFGAWSGSVAPTSNGTTGALSPTFTAVNGVAYTASAYIKGANGIPYRFGVGDSAGASMVGSTTFTGGGTWQRYSFSWTEASGATRALAIKKDASADTSAFYIDGVQVEAGSLTTYIDGDQGGCLWLGARHSSQSMRSGTYRGGGSVVALADLGLKPNDTPGVGMPPQEVTAQSYALQPGAEYQRSRAAERPFNLTFSPIQGTTLQGLHVTRRTLINAFKPSLVAPQQPVRFWYTGGQGTVQIDAVYSSGLDFGNLDGPMAEDGAVRFIAEDPYWYATTQQGTSLSCRQDLGSANYIVARDIYGRWGTLGANGSTLQGVRLIEAIAMGTDQTIFIGGSWGTVAGTAYPHIASYIQSTNTFGTLLGGTIGGAGGGNSPVRDIAIAPDNTLYVTGNMQTAGGTAARIAKYTTAWGTLTNGTISAGGNALLYSPTGTLYVGGVFVSAGGTTAPNVALWANGSWGTLLGQTAGTVDAGVYAFAYTPSQILYFTGAFSKAGGTTATGIALWRNGTFGTLQGGGLGGASGTTGLSLGVAPDQRLYVGGNFGSAGGGSAQNVAVYNGVGFQPLGSGVGTLQAALTYTTKVLPLADGRVLVAGPGWSGSAGAISLIDNIAIWTGATYLPLDIDLKGAADPNAYIADALQTPGGTLYVCGSFSGTAQAPAVAQLVNAGMGEAYPTISTRNIGASNISLYQIANTFTGDYLFFNNLVLQPAEEVTITTTPGARSFTSSFRGNIFGYILGGSNIASFKLMPGTNYLSMFASSGSLATSIYWTPRSESIDGGTIF